MSNKISFEFNACKVDSFAKTYSVMNAHMMQLDNAESRNGNIREILNWKTELTNPRKRCVGTSERDMNVFFLLAESLWIWVGRKDLSFLKIFNKNMANFSDDGKSFHAPYGFRMRKFGVNSFESETVVTDENKHAIEQQRVEGDQFLKSLRMLSGEIGDGVETRRAVIQIWNAELDLAKDTKDLPCNDLLMLQSRGGKLHATIANRSNDLHWGLPTNIFQFSTILEIFSSILGQEVGTQVHNSKSLHIYTDNPICDNMLKSEKLDLYDYTSYVDFDYNFEEPLDSQKRLSEIDYSINLVIGKLEMYNNDEINSLDVDLLIQDISKKSIWLARVFRLLKIYIKYKKSLPCDVKRSDAIRDIFSVGVENLNDFEYLGVNFFMKRIKTLPHQSNKKYIRGLLDCDKIGNF